MDKEKDKENLRLFGRLQAGDLSLPQNKDQAVMMMGLTKSGKTTSSYFFSCKPLVGFSTQGDIKYKVGGRLVNGAKIGFSANSQTEIPNHFQAFINDTDKISVYDCPGFLDTFGCHRMISNAYFNYRLFSKIKKMKFILTIKKSDINDPAMDFARAIKGFFDNFKDLPKIKKDVFEATTLLITRSDSGIEEIRRRLKYLNELEGYLSNKIPEVYHELFHQFVDHLLKKNKVFKIDQAKQGNTLQADKNNNLFGQIFHSCQFWKRKMQDQEMDMTNINFRVGKDIQNLKYNQELWKKYQSFLNFVKNRFKSSIDFYMSSVFKSFVDTIKQTNEKKDDYFNKMKQFNQQFYNIFEEEREEQRRELRRKLFQGQDSKSTESSFERKYSIYWIKKMKICQILFHSIYQPISDQIPSVLNYKWIDQTQKKMTDLLGKMYVLIPKKQRNHYSKFSYSIFRQLEQTKALFLLLRSDTQVNQSNGQQSSSGGFFDVHLLIQNSISNLFEKKFETLRAEFVSQYAIEKNMKPEQYKQILQFFEQTQMSIKSITKQQRKQFLKNKVQLTINSSEYYLTIENQIQKLTAIKSLDATRKSLQAQVKQTEQYGDNEQCKENIYLLYQTMNLMGQFFNQLGRFELAVLCFDSINNVSEVIQAYNKWIQCINSQQIKSNLEEQTKRKENVKKRLYSVYKRFGQYCLSHSQPQFGMRQLQNAYRFANSYKQLHQISDQISIANANSGAYLTSMADKQFYRELKQEQENEIYNIYGDEQLSKIQRIQGQSDIFINESLYK